MARWKEVDQTIKDKRCELVLSGQEISQRIEESGLDSSIFQITSLNFLEISQTCLETVPDEIGALLNLTSLILRGNKLQVCPSNISSLKKLKFLDLSNNAIETLPEDLQKLSDLQSFNVSGNKLQVLPNLNGMKHIAVLNFAQNEFSVFPESVCDKSLVLLAEISGKKNRIESIPAGLNVLSSLKIFDMSDNSILKVPGELGDCAKLKELHLKGNKLQDKRLLKLVEQCHVKQVIEYVRSHCPKESPDAKDQVKAKGKAGKKQNRKSEAGNEAVEQLLDELKVLHVNDNAPVVILKPAVQDVRPYIVCCLLKGVDFSDAAMFKKFISLQTKLHETVCEKRSAATIATHDLSKISGNITYDAKPPKEIKIIPLGRQNELTAEELYSKLVDEAEALRKEKKRNTYSGVHKYLYMLKNHTQYPCLVDSNGLIISFPPITNCNGTRISQETKEIFLEVTGNNLPVCKKVMDTLLHETLKLGISKSVTNESVSPQATHNLVVEQLKVVDEEGQLKVVYPSRSDLPFDDISVLR